jgi:hypothetical protein
MEYAPEIFKKHSIFHCNSIRISLAHKVKARLATAYFPSKHQKAWGIFDQVAAYSLL